MAGERWGLVNAYLGRPGSQIGGASENPTIIMTSRKGTTNSSTLSGIVASWEGGQGA